MKFELMSPGALLALLSDKLDLPTLSKAPTSASNATFAEFLRVEYEIDFTDVRWLTHEDLMTLWDFKRVWDLVLDFVRSENFEITYSDVKKPAEGADFRLERLTDAVFREEFNRAKQKNSEAYYRSEGWIE